MAPKRSQIFVSSRSVTTYSLGVLYLLYYACSSACDKCHRLKACVFACGIYLAHPVLDLYMWSTAGSHKICTSNYARKTHILASVSCLKTSCCISHQVLHFIMYLCTAGRTNTFCSDLQTLVMSLCVSVHCYKCYYELYFTGPTDKIMCRIHTKSYITCKKITLNQLYKTL